MELDLSTLDWTLIGWVPHAWAWLSDGQQDMRRHQVTPEIPARLPGSVQDDLRRAGLIPDWNVGTNARLCEWVEHRHWEYRTRVEVPIEWQGRRIILQGEGLDYEGFVLVDGVPVDTFHGMHVPHELDLTGHLTPGCAHQLSLVFTEAPHEQGQIGYTSRSQYLKARYPYGWDWCPRLVPLGVWDTLRLVPMGDVRIYGCLAYATYNTAAGCGSLAFRLDINTVESATLQARVILCDGDRVLIEEVLPCVYGVGRSETTLAPLGPIPVEPWWPNGMGERKLYRVSLQLETRGGQPVDAWSGCVGFKQVRWLPCEGAPANADPWICEVNGRSVFLRGINWTPVRMTYGSVTRDMYAKRLRLYADMGLNVLRVWGGATLERQDFYELCDELGLMVWQEFPLSSSGIDNTPPHAPAVLAELGEIASSYIWRRGGHASLLLWSGGNELFVSNGEQKPVDETDPCIAVLAGVSARLAPNVRFVPTSPSGATVWFDPAKAGMGLHHDVHGPWETPKDMGAWRAYWDGHDALLVSEVGVPSCSSVELLQRYAGEHAPWPPNADNPYWLYRAPWWIAWDDLAVLHGFDAAREELTRWVEVTQQLQAEALAYLAASCKQRFPRCGGVIFWMGHDCFPCPSNNSLVDYDGEPKPVVGVLRRIFREES